MSPLTQPQLEHTLVYLSSNADNPIAQKLQTELIKLCTHAV